MNQHANGNHLSVFQELAFKRGPPGKKHAADLARW